MNRLRSVVNELPLAVATAVITLVLALILSAALGSSSRNERAATRCYAAAAVNMLHDAFAANPIYEEIRENYPRINTDGLNCRAYLSSPSNEQPLIP